MQWLLVRMQENFTEQKVMVIKEKVKFKHFSCHLQTATHKLLEKQEALILGLYHNNKMPINFLETGGTGGGGGGGGGGGQEQYTVTEAVVLLDISNLYK